MWRPRFKFGDFERDRLITILDWLIFVAIGAAALVLIFYLFFR